jgi:acetate kinase
VHGGDRFTGPTRIDATVLAGIGELSELAPLHNPTAVSWIEAALKVCGPEVVQVGAFDTAFFADLPRVAREYAVARRIGTDHGVRRYGFHGLAHEAMLHRWQRLHPELPGGGRLITLQLGGGCSIAAISSGRPVDTSMGFSPLEGLVMATRSGDIDPAVVPYLQRRLSASADEILERLNRESGLAGLSGGSSDLSALTSSTDPGAHFAVDLYCYRARKYIGSYLAVLGGCDGIAFGGGVGEHVPVVRARVLEGLQWAGIELDRTGNEACQGQEARISLAHSQVAVHVIPVDEDAELMAAARAVLGDIGGDPG